MTLSEGARRRYRHSRGEFDDTELPPTTTAVQRGKARRRAKVGDLAAVTSRSVVEFLDTVRVSGSHDAVMSSGLATSSSSVFLFSCSMERSER
jgi:hypothetical protein